MQPFTPLGLGWVPDVPDARDLTIDSEAIREHLLRLRPSKAVCDPDDADLRFDAEGDYLSVAPDQGTSQCSSTFAVLALIEYFERRVLGHAFSASARFLHKATLNLARHEPSAENPERLHDGRCGGNVSIRATFKALTSIGVPPSSFWPYERDGRLDEPTSFVYAIARKFATVRYFRLDVPNRDGHTTWSTLTSLLAAGFPVAFGFPVPDSITTSAEIPFRPLLDSPLGGQAVTAVGFRNDYFGRGRHALLVRSSWGTRWGENGFGWLPHSYVAEQLARDFWTCIDLAWFDPPPALGDCAAISELTCPTVVCSRSVSET